MDFSRSDIQSMLLDSASRLLADTSGVEYWREQRRQPFGFDPARWQQFAELGWLALFVPESAGGLGGSLEDVALLNIELGKALATEPFASTAVLGAHVLAHAADAEKATALLVDLAGGALRLALAHQEPGGDPLAADVTVTAARRTDFGYTLSGEKMLVLDAGGAHAFIVSARTEGDEGTALFLVDADTAGVAIDTYPLIDGTRAGDIRFTDVRLPATALLSGGKPGAALLEEGIALASIAHMAQAVGAMEAAIRICGDYAKERRQFGAPIGSFQSIQHILADMFVASNQARSMLYRAIAGSRSGDAGRRAAISAARIVIGEAGQLVSRSGIQVHGGYGLTDEYAISHYFRRLMSIEKQYGDLAVHSARFGDTLFD